MSDAPVLKVRPDLESVAPYISPQQPATYRMNTNEARNDSPT